MTSKSNTLIPAELLRLWSTAVELHDEAVAQTSGADLANWLNDGGAAPAWSPELEAAFWGWWDEQHDSTTVYTETAPAPSEAATIQALKNLGHDTECGTCMEIAFTGSSSGHPHTCSVLPHPSAVEALRAAECSLTEHGANYCADDGGEHEPGLASVLARVRGALGALVLTKPLLPPRLLPLLPRPWEHAAEAMTQPRSGRTRTDVPNVSNPPRTEPVPGPRCPACNGTDLQPLQLADDIVFCRQCDREVRLVLPPRHPERVKDPLYIARPAVYFAFQAAAVASAVELGTAVHKAIEASEAVREEATAPVRDALIWLEQWIADLPPGLAARGEAAAKIRGALSELRLGPPTVCCEECGGINVQTAMWCRPNRAEIVDDYGSWDVVGDSKWCEDCEDHTELIDAECEPERFAEARAKHQFRIDREALLAARGKADADAPDGEE